MLWNMLFGLCILGTVRYGDFITDECPQGGYACPKICDVDHKHYPRKGCEDAKGKRDLWKTGWSSSKEEGDKVDVQKNYKEEIEESENAKEKKSRRSKSAIQSGEQLDQEAMGIYKSEGI